ncbi:hypothetical protein [Bradyrhizobium canariense]|uniref:AbiTii domain-containing protein n=1 Tax=Bradyrhizobium canariense TaxID=255045 RepID=A0A1H1MJU6_9BRAD|nr:hypothetical protein [Bradyrhizobium canariense]SDR87053.1 hypothetical protein SAMN05444158_0252 [Bradyrhizobium canariense]
MDYQKVVERIYEHLEEDRVESAVMASLRMARAAKDYINSATFLRELYPSKTEVVRALYDEISLLKKDAQQFIFEKSLERWLELHTVETATPDEDRRKPEGDRRNVFMVAAGQLQSELDQAEHLIGDLALPAGMGEFDTAAFTDRFITEKARMRFRIRAIQTIKARLKVRCLNYAIEIERQLAAQKQNQAFLESVQNDVNNYFKARCDDVFVKLRKAAQLTQSKDAEDSALLLTEVRRAMKAAADHFYPPVPGLVVCADGKQRSLGDDQFLNRLHEYLARQVERSTSKELLKEELDHLAAFIRRLNDMASKGVHADVTFAEAKQGLIGVYFFLFNLIQHLTRATVAVA